MVTLKVKGRSGQISEIQVEQILEIDGRPYKASADDVREMLIHQDGRLTAIETFLSRLLTAEPQGAAING